jgi:DNA repair protein RadC
VVDNKLIVTAALLVGAVNIILAHNHPSGSLQPSRADQEVTQQIQNACSYLDIKLLDHLIITSEGYLSMADAGLL